MNDEMIAVLIRGFCLNLTGNPCTVVSKPGEDIPAGAMKITVSLPYKADAEKTEKSIAETMAADNFLAKEYDRWKAEHSKEINDGEVLLPSCVALCVNNNKIYNYWIDCDLDSARKRFLKKNVEPLKINIIKTEALIKGDERAAVVKNKIAVVTGGAQGIGEEISRNLAATGALVFIADLNLKGAEKLAEEINAKEGCTAALAVEVNVCDEPSVDKMFKFIAETAGGLDLCISNAGVLKAGSVLEQELCDFKFVTDINYTGFFVISKFAGRLLGIQHQTAPFWKTDIIQINSKSGLEGSNKNGAYAGGKFGGLGLVASFALELVKFNIKVNAICPGNFLDGPLWSDPDNGLFVQYLKTGKVPGAKTAADVRSFYEARVPLKRGCTGKDLVRALYYIVEQEYETGQAVPVTGGQVMLH